jgi:hypothetical protein
MVPIRGVKRQTYDSDAANICVKSHNGSSLRGPREPCVAGLPTAVPSQGRHGAARVSSCYGDGGVPSGETAEALQCPSASRLPREWLAVEAVLNSPDGDLRPIAEVQSIQHPLHVLAGRPLGCY